jgi:hypothetical protein
MPTDQERAAALADMERMAKRLQELDGAYSWDIEVQEIRALLTEPRPEVVTVEELLENVDYSIDGEEQCELGAQYVLRSIRTHYPHGIIVKDKT